MPGTRAAAEHITTLLLGGIRVERAEGSRGKKQNRKTQESSQVWTCTPVILAA